jgi:glycosyltransferase involved in cell wall biosynthesis
MTELKIIVTHPTGNRNVRAVMSAFESAGILSFFGTTLAFNPESKVLKLVPEKIRKELIRRSYPIDFDLVHTRPILELSRNVLPRLGFNSAIAHETGFASVDRIYSDLDKATSRYLKHLKNKNTINAVYGYEDGMLYTFREARKLGIECIYDLPIGYWKSARNLLSPELERWPEWAATLTGFQDSLQKLERKDEELRLANKIFVASSFTAKTLEDFPGKLASVEVIPYGFPTVVESRDFLPMGNQPLKLLFVGGLSQRKGIANLFAAVKNIGKKHVELTIVGRKTNADCPALDAALREHKYTQFATS